MRCFPTYFTPIFILLMASWGTISFGEAVTPGVQSSPSGVTNSGPPAGIMSSAALALPPAPAQAPGQKSFTSPIALDTKVIKAYVLADPTDAVKRISKLIGGVKPYCTKGRSYKKENASGRLLLSLCILTAVLEKGPMTEYEALGIKKDESSNILSPEEKITISEALATAVADFNTLSKELYLDHPSLLLNPTPFITFVREELLYLKNAEKRFLTINKH